jgi:GT2 family glycosyltransferase
MNEMKTLIAAFPESLVLRPVSRNPIQLPASTVDVVMAQPVCIAHSPSTGSISNERMKVSIIVVTFNNLVFNRICIQSVLANTTAADYELIVVDNGSTDGTQDYLRSVALCHEQIRLIINDRNRGFAPAVNQGLLQADGDYFVLLNNDTLAPAEWLATLLKYLGNPDIGLVGPVTNRAGNEAQIQVPYKTYGELTTFCRQYSHSHAGEAFDIPMLTMYCVAMRRDVYERVGPLDERFQIGLFEDEDYCMRVRASGYRIICAEDAFVHHFGQASLGKLASSGEYGTLFHENRRRWENKWRCLWQPHQHRRSSAYEQLVDDIRTTVKATLPPASIVAVVSKGDSELVTFDDTKAWHFPQDENGQYSGHYPSDSSDAISQLEETRAKGAQFLLFPETSLWWLDHYQEFGTYLRTHFRTVKADPRICLIFALHESEAAVRDRPI